MWFLRQAGRYMAEYQAVRRHHSLLEICRTPQLAAEVTITAAEKLDVDAAIIFADLLLPFTPMGLDFEFVHGEGPAVHNPVRTSADVDRLRTDRVAELGYVAEAIQQVSKHFNNRLGIIGFCGAPYTLASYMIEGAGSRNWIETKSLMYRDPGAFRALLEKLIEVLVPYCAQQVEAGADVIQVFDSWVGSLSAGGLSRVRTAAHHAIHSSRAGAGRACHLLRRRHSKPSARNAHHRSRCARAWTGECRSTQHGQASITHAPYKAISIPSRSSPRRLCFVNASTASSRRQPVVPATSSMSDTASSPATPVENVQAAVRFVREYAASFATATVTPR